MFSKYLDYTEPANQAHINAQKECQQKDILIGQLKGQIYQLKQLQGDYSKLNELIHSLEGKYSLLLAEKERSQKEQRVKSDIDKKNIIDLRADIDELRVQLQKANLLIEQLLRSNSSLKRQNDGRTGEIQAIRFQIKEIQNKNQRSNDENRGLALTLKALKEQRKNIEDECQNLSNLLDASMNKLKNLQKEVRGAQSGNTRLEKTLYQAEKDNNKLIGELKEKGEDIKKAENKFKTLSNSITDLGISYKNLEQQTAKSKVQLERNTSILNGEVAKGKELQSKIAAAEAQIRSHQNDLDLVISEEEKLRKEHFVSLDKNKTLNLQIDKVLGLIAEYELVNRELLDQIQIFIDQDKQARSRLEREELMQDVIEGSLRKVALTEEPIRHLKC